jgi:hypothetical protein
MGVLSLIITDTNHTIYVLKATLLVWVEYPWEQLFQELYFNYIGIPAKCPHSGMCRQEKDDYTD